MKNDYKENIESLKVKHIPNEIMFVLVGLGGLVLLIFSIVLVVLGLVGVL